MGYLLRQNSKLQGSTNHFTVDICAVSCIKYLGIFTVHIRYVSMSVFVPQHESSLSEVLSENLRENSHISTCYHWFMMVCPSQIASEIGLHHVVVSWVVGLPPVFIHWWGTPHWGFPCFLWGLMIPQRREIAANARPPFLRLRIQNWFWREEKSPKSIKKGGPLATGGHRLQTLWHLPNHWTFSKAGETLCSQLGNYGGLRAAHSYTTWSLPWGFHQLDLLKMVIFPIGNPLLGESIVFFSLFFHAFLKQIQDQGELKKVKVQPNVQEVYTVYTWNHMASNVHLLAKVQGIQGAMESPYYKEQIEFWIGIWWHGHRWYRMII